MDDAGQTPLDFSAATIPRHTAPSPPASLTPARPDLKDPDRGCLDPARFRRRHPDDREPKLDVTPQDAAATRDELGALKRRMTRKFA
jgi:hypothetical protein